MYIFLKFGYNELMIAHMIILHLFFNVSFQYISSYMEAYHNNELKASEISSLREGLEVRDRKVEEEIRNQNEKIKDLKEKIERMQEEYERELEKEKCKRDIAVRKYFVIIYDNAFNILFKCLVFEL